MGIQGFIQKYFIEPLYYDSFNPVNTVVYAVLFLLLIVLILRVFERYDIPLDARFYSFFLGFIFLGAFLGVLRDVKFYGSPLLSTPGIYMGLSVLLLSSIILGKYGEKGLGITYSLIPQVAVYSFIAYLALRYLPEGVTLYPVIYILLMGVLLAMGVLVFLRKMGIDLLESRVNFGIFLAHMLDASSTYLGITMFGFSEKFFVTGYVMEAISPLAVFPVKALLVLLVLYYIEKEDDLKGRNKDVIKAALILLGLAPALRNTFLSVLS